MVINQLLHQNRNLPGYDMANFLLGDVAQQFEIHRAHGGAFVGDESCWAAAAVVHQVDPHQTVYLATSQLYRMVHNIMGGGMVLGAANPPGGHAERAVVNAITADVNLNFRTVPVPLSNPQRNAGVLYVELSPCGPCAAFLGNHGPIGGVNDLYVWFSHQHNAQHAGQNTANLRAQHAAYRG